MGSVWLADHVQLRSPVAIKLIDPALAQSREIRSRFLREARAAGALRSSHVVQVFDYGMDGDTPFLVMEYLEGENLATRLERRKTLPLAEVQVLMRQVGRALAKAHSVGIVHRDLKPENIFVVSEADNELVKVLDFGIAKVEASLAVSVQTQTGMVLGTPFYMSPEQAEGRRELDARSDVWSLGVIVYECLLGRRPFDGETLAQIILAICADPLPVPSSTAPVPAGFDQWFARANERRVEARYQSVAEMVEGLLALSSEKSEAVAAGERTVAPVTSEHERQALTEQATNAAVRPAPVSTTPEPPLPATVPMDTPHDFSMHSDSSSGDDSPAHIPLHNPWSPVLWSVVGVIVLGVVSFGVVSWRGSPSPDAAALESNETSASQAIEPTQQPSVASEPEVRPQPAAEVVRAARDSASVTNRPAPPNVVTVPADINRQPPASAGSGIPERGGTRPELMGGSTIGGRDKPSKPETGRGKNLYCTEHALSGRLVKAPGPVTGSFPCYQHAISGQLRRKN